jgi:glycosyltransferase involved in cell wall biosynthesis
VAERRQVKVLLTAGLDLFFKTFLSELIKEMRAEGWQVDCAATPSGAAAELERMGARVISLPYGRAAADWRNIPRFFKLAALIGRERYDIVHAHNPLAALVGRLAACAARTPVIIYTVHGFNFHENTRPLKKWLGVTSERIAGRCTTFTFFVSREDCYFATMAGITPPNRALHISNGVDAEVYSRARFSTQNLAAVKRGLELPEKGPVVAMVARFSYEKGMREFIEAAAIVGREMPEARFVFIGGRVTGDHSQPSNELVESWAKAAGAEGFFRATGMRDDVPLLLACCNVFCLPSYREGMPRSIIEAMAMELPVVATNIRGCREEVIEGETGFLIPVYDAKALAEKVLVLLRDKELAQRFGKRAREIVLKQYVEKDIVRTQIGVIKRLLAERGRLPA